MLQSVSDLSARLEALRERTNETPLFNPAFQLSLELSRALEGGELTLDAIEAMIAELECDALQSRARRLRGLLEPVGIDANLTGFAERLTSEPADFVAFRKRWERPQLHCVFTAHPTFLLSPPQTAAVVHAASQEGDIDAAACAAPSDRPTITLDFEHERALEAIANAADARDRLVGTILRHASTEWPAKWHALKPLPFRFASYSPFKRLWSLGGRTAGWRSGTSLAAHAAQESAVA